MKKIAISLITLLLMVIAVGCGNRNENITKEDLQKNDWIAETEDDDDDAVMTVTFSETNLTFGIDTSSLQIRRRR
ncbi:hypothetical protein [Enterococcus casseliflavus]|uniref:hypothetical protein n=1 Tax=Enterococcus casseliflavus TaxID=37734 RepID=UPI0035DAAF51